ncbi:MAG: tyrosine-type recombinase/integrase, partial [Gammaproteobacteria bacterium]
STGTPDRTQAREFHDKLKASLWEQARLGVKPSHTWNEAVVRYLAESKRKTCTPSQRAHLRWLHAHLDGLELERIDRTKVDELRQRKLADGVSPTTVNRQLEPVRAILRKAAGDWEWLTRAPTVRMLPEPKRRIRWLSREEAGRLIQELPKHLKSVTGFSLETGLRKANVTGLEWSQVDLARCCAWIHPDQAKARRAIAVPLSAAAVEIVRAQQGKHADYVFSYQGKPLIQVNTKAWKAALKRAGIADFRWHDLRHTWASWHVQAGTPLHALQELGGWECAEMVRRYAHLSSEHLAVYAQRMSGAATVTATTNVPGYDLATENVSKLKGDFASC